MTRIKRGRQCGEVRNLKQTEESKP